MVIQECNFVPYLKQRNKNIIVYVFCIIDVFISIIEVICRVLHV